MATATPRAAIVHRPTDYDLLLARHATRGQAAFFLDSRGQDIDAIEDEHRRLHDVLDGVRAKIPERWRRVDVLRGDLGRFLFEPDDLVLAVGQDGLVANLAKYLDGQLVIGVNPLRERFDGVLVRVAPDAVSELLLAFAGGGSLEVESRTMAHARLDDGQSLLALNEIFVGHRTHQSARYVIRHGDAEERQSSSGVIVTTGTGSTGWARSLNLSRGSIIDLPQPTERRLAFLVREAFPSVATGTSLTTGVYDARTTVDLTSEMNEDGVVFGDGMESDYLSFDWGRTLEIGVAQQTLNLVRAHDAGA